MICSSFNNKGFAITGILYTLFILFLLILVSVLAGLQSRKNMLSRSILGLEESYAGKKRESLDLGARDSDGDVVAPVTGKYVFKIKAIHTEGTDQEYSCSTYLIKGTKLKENDVTFVPKDCNDYPYTFSFHSNSVGSNETGKNVMTLEEIYQFESE